jgi:peroxiredoxin
MKISYLRAGVLSAALALVGCLGHEKPHAITPAERVGTRTEGTGIQPGEMAPDPPFIDRNGKRVALSSLRQGRRMLLVFYRGGWCPPCNYQIHTLSKHHREFAKRRVVVVGVSVDRLRHAKQTSAEYKTPFTLLSDPDLVFHRAFRVLDPIGGFTSFLLDTMGADLEERSGREHDVVAVPSVFLVDTDGKIRFAHTDEDYSTRPSVDQLLAAIDAVDPLPPGPSASPGTAVVRGPESN